jgi:hypothetical protein
MERMMDVRSVLAIAAAATAAVQAEELERELQEFELDEPPAVADAPWLARAEGADEETRTIEH